MQVALICLGVAAVALLVLWLQVRALSAELKTEKIRTASLTEALESSERQLAEAIEDYNRLDGLLAERNGMVATISARMDKIRHDITKIVEAADEQVRQCFAARIPAALSDRLRGGPDHRDKDRVRAPADESSGGMP